MVVHLQWLDLDAMVERELQNGLDGMTTTAAAVYVY